MYYVVGFRGRCMGFCSEEKKALDIVEVLGEGAWHEESDEPFPTDEFTAATEWNRRWADPFEDAEQTGVRMLPGVGESGFFTPKKTIGSES